MERRDLWRLPPDLMAMRWQLVSSREVPRPTAPTWYTVMYARPFERGSDDNVLAIHLHGNWWIQVTTPVRTSLSWENAHRDAIVQMRDADARRKPDEVGPEARRTRACARSANTCCAWGDCWCMG